MASWRWFAAAVMSVALVTAPRPAGAQEEPAGPDEESGEDVEARALFDAGRVAFDQGRFENSLEYFRRAYELSARPGMLFNIGTAADRLRRDREALEAFERYLEAEPASEHLASVEARIIALRRALADNDADDRAPVGASSADPAPWIVFGTAAAVAVAGGVLLGVALVDLAAIEDLPDGETWANLADDVDRVRVLSGVGIAALAVGGAGMIAGLAWALTAGGGGTSAEVRIGPGGVVLAGRFP